jgi:hypothetical protein
MTLSNVSNRVGPGQDVGRRMSARVTWWLPLVLVASVIGFIVWRVVGVSSETAAFYGPPVLSSVRTQAGMVESRLALARRDAEWLGTALVGRSLSMEERTRLMASSEFVALRVRDRTGATLLSLNADALPDGDVPDAGVTTISTAERCLLVVRAPDPTGANREITAWIEPTDRLMGRMIIMASSPIDAAQTVLLTATRDSIHVLSAPGGQFFVTGQSFGRSTAPRLIRHALGGDAAPALGPAPDGRPVIAAAAAVANSPIIALRAVRMETAVQRQRGRLARDLLIAGLLGAIGVALAIGSARERRTHQLETALLRTRLESLQQHLRPHFLFNALTAIGELAHTSPARAEAVVLQLSNLLRESLALPANAIVSLQRELTLLDSYLAVERERFGDALTVTVTIPQSLLATGVLPWTLQPLLENALKHGARPCHVSITARRDHGAVWLRVSNTMRTDAPVTAGTGVGLSNLRDRLLGVFGRDDALTVRTEGDQFVVEVRVPDQPAKTLQAA